MRILNLIPTLSGGGAERQLTNLSLELVKLGHDVHIAYYNEGPERPDLTGVVLHRIKCRSYYDPSIFRQLLALTRRLKPALLHTWIMQMDILGGAVASITGTPWLFREPSGALAYGRDWKGRLRVAICRRATAVVSNSLEGDEYWAPFMESFRRHIIGNALNLDDIARGTPAPWAERLPIGTPIVLCAGRLTESKNLPNLLRALSLLSGKSPFFAIICGEGPQYAELLALRDRLGLAEKVQFTGYSPTSGLWSLMKRASMFVSLSAFEGCPNTVMEAAACGCPLVLSSIPAHKRLLGPSEAVFVDSSDYEQTAAAINSIIGAGPEAHRRARIVQSRSLDWSIARIAPRWVEVYESVASVGADSNPS
jgi:glycosyltransferase involved in cell wall biosynthesis